MALEGMISSLCCVMAGDGDGNAVYLLYLHLSVWDVASCGVGFYGEFPLAC